MRRNVVPARTIPVLACSAALLMTGAASAAPTGRIKATVRDAPGTQVCVVRPKKPHRTVGRCRTAKGSRAKLTFAVAPGTYLLQVLGGAGAGPCYSRKGTGYGFRGCTKVRVKAGRTARLTWRVPVFG